MFERCFGSICQADVGYDDLVFRPRFFAVLAAVELRLGAVAWKV